MAGAGLSGRSAGASLSSRRVALQLQVHLQLRYHRGSTPPPAL
jgi:hypothetical protein